MPQATPNPLTTLWRLHDAMSAPHGGKCASCGEVFDDESPNIEAFEEFAEIVCDACSEEAFEKLHGGYEP